MNNNIVQIEELDNIVYLSVLYDFYGELLTDSKKQMFEDYYLNDLSLAEIAKEQGISRQGVHDSVKRTAEELKGYESRLSLMSKFQSVKNKLEEIDEISDIINKNKDIYLVNSIKELIKDILKEL
ncbi:MAG TPA: DNA-binding protein [Clostridiales bacterium]|nr:DNA-binding protein [Clostridiales bacterium]